MAQRDPAAWGNDSDSFVLRDAATYHKLSVGWAEPAMAEGGNGAPNSRVCPGKQLSIVMMSELLKAFVGAGGVDAWSVEFAPTVKTKVVDWTGCATTRIEERAVSPRSKAVRARCGGV